MQAFHLELDADKNFDTDLLRNVAYLSGEIGEVVSAIQRLSDAEDSTDRASAQDNLGEELADCLAYILKLANYAHIDLQETYVAKMKRNLGRNWHKK
jgi:NTP pyrophosphatase (non-canonical NTP hydrolase)